MGHRAAPSGERADSGPGPARTAPGGDSGPWTRMQVLPDGGGSAGLALTGCRGPGKRFPFNFLRLLYQTLEA